MTRSVPGAALVAALLVVAGCGSGAGPTGASGDPGAAGAITVWLQSESQTLWPQAVTAATDRFHAAFPKVTVNLQYQTWTDHLTKFDAAAQAHTLPDVIEFGNSETAQYIAAGALRDLTAARSGFDNSAQWLDGLVDSCTAGGKLYCVPYYGGDRAVTYRTDIFADAGITRPPGTWSELLGDVSRIAARHAADPAFSAFYMPGSYPYGGLPFVYDAGGVIAAPSGGRGWKASLSSPAAQAGLANWKALIDAGYRGDRTATNLTAYTVLVNGTAAMFYDTSGQMAAVFGPKGDPALRDKIGTFPLPSPVQAGRPVPPFLGGSDLAVPAASGHPEWAQAWIRAYTSTPVEREFVAGGFLANCKTITSSDPLRAAFAAELEHTWFVPLAKNWAQVEKDKIINNMLVAIATGRQSIAAATRAADQAIDKDLNEPG
jgi:N,N'-diacetylchitobiose transport system substrate-binding protein